MKITPNRLLYWFGLILVVYLSFTLHQDALDAMFPNGNGSDVDEGFYVQNGETYADALETGNISKIIKDEDNYEHPQLAKILFGISISIFGEDGIGENSNLDAARYVSILAAIILTVLIYHHFGIIASLLWTYSTWVLKYTSEAYLESVLALFSYMALWTTWLYLEDRRTRSESTFTKYHVWLFMSAIFSAAAFASKYTGFITVAISFVIILLSQKSTAVGELGTSDGVSITNKMKYIVEKSSEVILLPILWGITFIVSFIVFNPRTLNFDLFLRSLFFHQEYSQSEGVNNPNPWHQFTWIFSDSANPTVWHRDFPVEYNDNLVFFLSFIAFGFISLCLILSYHSSLRDNYDQNMLFKRIFQSREKFLIISLFYLGNLLFLLSWSTKWPQYLVLFQLPSAILVGTTGEIIILYMFDLFVSWTEIFKMRDKSSELNRRQYFVHITNSIKNIPISLIILLLLVLVGMVSYRPLENYVAGLDDEQEGSPLDNEDNDDLQNGDQSDNDNGDVIPTIDWSIETSSVGENQAQTINNTYIWKDAENDDRGDGDFTYPSNPVFDPGESADLLEFQFRVEAEYYLISVTLARLADVGWGSEIGQDLSAIFIGIDIDSEEPDTTSFPSIVDSEVSFPTGVEVLISIVRSIKVETINNQGAYTTSDLSSDLYQLNTVTSTVQIALLKSSVPTFSNSIRLYAGVGLEEFSSTREVNSVQEEWKGGGGVDGDTGDEADFYDLAFAASQVDQEQALGNNEMIYVEIQLSDLI